MEAAGAETIHALNHLKYPRFIKEARAEGREDAAKSFELALEREKHHDLGGQGSPVALALGR